MKFINVIWVYLFIFIQNTYTSTSGRGQYKKTLQIDYATPKTPRLIESRAVISVFRVFQICNLIFYSSSPQNGQYPKQTLPTDSVTLRPVIKKFQYRNMGISIFKICTLTAPFQPQRVVNSRNRSLQSSQRPQNPPSNQIYFCNMEKNHYSKTLHVNFGDL